MCNGLGFHRPLTLTTREEDHRCYHGLSVEPTDKFNQSQNCMTPQAQDLQPSGSYVIGQPMREA